MSWPFYSDARNLSFFLLLLEALRHTFYFHAIPQELLIINTPPKPFRPTDVPFVGYKTETKDLGEFLAAKSIFTIVAPSSE